MSTNFLFSKVCWQSPARFCLHTSNFPTHNLNSSLKVKVVEWNPGYLLKSFYFMHRVLIQFFVIRCPLSTVYWWNWRYGDQQRWFWIQFWCSRKSFVSFAQWNGRNRQQYSIFISWGKLKNNFYFLLLDIKDQNDYVNNTEKIRYLTAILDKWESDRNNTKENVKWNRKKVIWK